MFTTKSILHHKKKYSGRSSRSSRSSKSSCGFDELASNENVVNDDSEDGPFSINDDITNDLLSSFNQPQERESNRSNLQEYGGVNRILEQLEINIDSGLLPIQVLMSRKRFGENAFPLSKLSSFLELLFQALSDTTLLILLVAAAVSIIIGTIENPKSGYAEGVAIYIAVILAGGISAFNDYSKQLAFRSLELSAQNDERATCIRDGKIEKLNPVEIVVGDILILQPGDLVPADAILLTKNIIIQSDESSLTGEANTVKKDTNGDPFLLSSCLITQGEQCKALVIGIGLRSQWGTIKENLVIEPVNTPLQDKLARMTKLIGYIGFSVAFCTALSLISNIWLIHHGRNISTFIIEAVLISVTIIVVAVPEGLPLAVTISLAYSTKKMYQDQCFIRVLAACETMGNATTICSDKTGTLTENRMTVVEGFFADTYVDQTNFAGIQLNPKVKQIIIDHVAVNRNCYILYKDSEGALLHKPNVIGSKTEGALLHMIRNQYGIDEDLQKLKIFNEGKGDKFFSFDSVKKCSVCIIHLNEDQVRVFVKGASEVILESCSQYLDNDGNIQRMDSEKKREILDHIVHMGSNALRTLLLGHKDMPLSQLPPDWQQSVSPPLQCQNELICDCVVGIIDPLRQDVYQSISIAQQAGVTVRMVTGDNIITAKAIAKRCGILTKDGIAIEGPVFRSLTPSQLDSILPRLQILARSSPMDKFLLVSRLNGYALPANELEWNKKYPNCNYSTQKDTLLPGHLAEWQDSRIEADVVAVTGDGTNDAPALKAADVGLAMGITGTKVAQGASDIVILDDKFSSIIKAISWGRNVYDNIRKFLQFQLTVNISALTIVFVSAITGTPEPITAVEMLWVNLIMDSLGALALATEAPSAALLSRKPYKRSASLISRPMWRNILVQSLFQITLLLTLMFRGSKIFNVNQLGTCLQYGTKSLQERNLGWDPVTLQASYDSNLPITCSSFVEYCGNDASNDCFETNQVFNNDVLFSFSSLEHYDKSCLLCIEEDYTLSTIIFNVFIFCQLANELSSRKLGNEINFLQGLRKNNMFIGIIIFSVVVQIIIVEFGGSFMKTTPLHFTQWLITIAIASGTIAVGVLMRVLIPIKEDPKSFFTGGNIISNENSGRSGYTINTADSSLKSVRSSKKHNKSKSKMSNDMETKDITEELTAKLLINL